MPLAKTVRLLTASAVLTGAAVAIGSAPASAAERHRDYIYADTYGNLVIYSSAGYKRIIVGKGHLAGELQDYTDSGDAPNVVRAGEDEYARRADCYRPPVMVRGNSFMYGLTDGEIPEPAGSCYDRSE